MTADAGAGQVTIFALASGAGRAAVAVLRLSGPDSAVMLRALCRRMPPPRRASLCTLRDGTGEALDEALVLWFPGPASYTGEDCAELHLHGSRAVIAAVAEALVALGARPAEPGEFTRRAFLNGRMDLLEAEGIADLIDAETAAQRRQALQQMAGALSAVYHGWAARLRQALAWQEAVIDFASEDLPAETEMAVLHEVAELGKELRSHLADGRRGERLRAGLTFVVVGAPNVGKSSLMNALAGRDVAIVAATAGTTRDAIEVRVDLGGVPVTLIDTAGLRAAADAVEAEGIRRARAHAEAADLVLWVRDLSCPGDEEPAQAVARRLMIWNKSDLTATTSDGIVVSARTGAGMDVLRDVLSREAMSLAAPGDGPALTRARHRASLLEAARALEAAAEAPFADLRGEELRVALRSLARITGAVGVEDLLDTIFGTFCIGK